ncbi:hypothetical protein [Nocardia cyriacigeorgica]|jgi:hypothetical protein|nr:hypothetical protein [Nocardia cyriacigeorgica]
MTEPDQPKSDIEKYEAHIEEQHTRFFGLPLYLTEEEKRQRLRRDLPE